jgi:cyclic pyranopterin phosphate synthase
MGPFVVRFSVTEACALRCQYCAPPAALRAAPPDDGLSREEIRLLVQQLHGEFGVSTLRFTGGEPLLRPDLVDLVSDAAGLGIPDIAITTNGQGLAALAGPLRRAGLTRVNISLDAVDPALYRRISGGGDLSLTLAGIEASAAAGLTPVKLNMVVVRGLNDHETPTLLEYGLASGCHIRFLELMPMGPAAEGFAERFVPADEVLAHLDPDGRWQELRAEPGASSRNFRVEDGNDRQTICGVIAPYSHPFCDGCRRLRITARGELIGCLVRGKHLPLRPALAEAAQGEPLALGATLREACSAKSTVAPWPKERCMAYIGG